jgi:GNAT superfamily N-acetyltransferase
VVDVLIRQLAKEELERVRPVWLSLLELHAGLPVPGLTSVAPDQSWRRRRDLYLEWLTDGFALVAEERGKVVGYALVSVHDGSVLDDTWRCQERVAELQTLALLPRDRGQGIGTVLMDALEARLRQLGIREWIVGVVSENSDALRFYEHRGFSPYLVQLFGRIDPD